MDDKQKGYVIAVTSAVLYGMMPLLTKTIYQSGSNSFTVAFLRFVIGAVIFLILSLALEKASLGLTKRELKELLILSVGYGFTPVLLYTSYNYLASGLATTIHFVYPVLVVLGSAVCGIGGLGPKKILCCVLSLAGIVCFYTPGGEVSLTGVLIALASGVLYAFYTVYLQASHLLEMPACKLSFWKHLFSALIVGICAAVFRQVAFPGTARGWIFMLLLGMLTAASSFLYQQATRYAGAQDSALLSTFEPLTSVVIGYYVFEEALTGRNIAGIVCILLSVILLSTGGKEKKEA